MKKYLITSILLTFCFVINAQTVVQMEEYNGVYRIPCTVNGAKMKFIFDTGASNVCLSKSMAEYLLDNDYISKFDLLGIGTSTVADGRIVDHINIMIKDLEIQGTHLYNVTAVVVEGLNAPLLMGQSAIQKLGKIEINGNQLIITNGTTSDNQQQIERLFDEARQAYTNKQYAKAVDIYGQLYAMNELSDYGIYRYAWACWMNQEDKKALDLVNSIKDYSYFEENKIDIYRLIGNINRTLHNYWDAANYYELSSKKIQTEKDEWFENLIDMGDCYYYAESYTKAAESYRLAAMLYALMKGVDMAYLQRDSKNQLKKKEPSYRNDRIDYTLFQLFFCNERSGEWTTEGFLFEATAMARAGNKYARKMCNEAGIDPDSEAWK